MKTLSALKSLFNKACISFFLFFVLPLKADIPSSDDFIDGADNQDGVETLYFIIEKFLQVVVLGVMCWIVILIMKGAGKKYDEISEGKATYVDLAGHVVGGVAVVAVGVIAANWVGSWVD